MTTPTDQILTRLAETIARGATLYFFNGDNPIPLRAASWIEGKGLLIAEAGSVDQSGVHLIPADALSGDTDTIDIHANAFVLVASISPDVRTSAPELPEGWAAFWADEIENAKGGE